MAPISSSASGADPATIEKVATIVADILKRQARVPRSLDPDESLTDAGVSSLDMVNLMLGLEASFDIFIPAELIKPSSFRSIASIAAMVDGLRAEPVALAS